MGGFVPRPYPSSAGADPEKREHCAAIGASRFIDDRLDVLEYLVGLVPHS